MSAREYCHITQEEFESALGLNGELRSGLAFLFKSVPGCRELVYEAIIDDSFSVRIYSSIVPGQGARDSGKDAIRVIRMFWTPDGRLRPVGKEKRVNRIQTWRDNLLARIAAVASEKEIGCPLCGGPMKERRGAYGKFYGCLGYPACKGIRKAER